VVKVDYWAVEGCGRLLGDPFWLEPHVKLVSSKFQFLEAIPRSHTSKPYLDQTEDDSLPHDIETYLDSPRILWHGSKTDDQTQWILDWWNTNSSQYQCIVQAAQEILAIPASEVDCERLFSDGRDLLSIRRYVMSREMMRIMILLKSALRSFKGLFTVEEVPKPRSIASQSALSMPNTGNM
jgi:hypothetical protein